MANYAINLVLSLALILSAKGSTIAPNSTKEKLDLESRGQIKDRQARDQCEILQEMSQRSPSELMAMRSPPPADEAVIRCYIRDGFECFPKDNNEIERLKNLYNDGHENPDPAHAKNLYCASGKCVFGYGEGGVTRYAKCGPCNETLRGCVPFKPSTSAGYVTQLRIYVPCILLTLGILA